MFKNRKPLIIGILCTLIVFMAIGFALLSQELTITGTSSIDSNWNIRITNIRVKNLTSAYGAGTNASADVSGSTGCTTKTAPCDSTSANFEVKLITPGDSITYEVTITNSGNLDGVVESINLTCSENEAITCTTSGLSRADTISHTSPNNTNTVDVTVTYNNATTTQPASTTSDITLTINYQQNLGQLTPTYSAYSIGDTITYKDTTWKVIKNSTASEDYVTLMKETVLTNAELGTYAYNQTYDTAKFHDSSNVYTTSNVKAAVEAYATSKGMMNDLTEVAVGGINYKVRLITYDELMNTFGFEEYDIPCGGCGAKGWQKSTNTPQWIYQNYGEHQNAVDAYCTMTPYSDNESYVWLVFPGGRLDYSFVGTTGSGNYGYGVRPVINLLKTAIPAQS